MEIVDENQKTDEQAYHNWVHAENIAIEEELYDRAVTNLSYKGYEITTRYANDKSDRNLYTPKQQRRIRKQNNKYRRRYFGKF